MSLFNAVAPMDSGRNRTIALGRFVACVLLLLAVGCDQPKQTLPPSAALPPNDTVEGKLARVMQRLDSAIEDAQAASGSGVVSERKAYEKIVRPEGDSGPYEAIITIETTRALAPIAINEAAQRKAEAEARKDGRELTEEEAKKLVVQDTVKTEVTEYKLVYDGAKWKLKNNFPPPAEGESISIDQILLEYALKQ